MVEILWDKLRPAYKKFKVGDLQVGDVVVNAYHDPENMPDSAGLYFIVRNPADIDMNQAVSYIVFAINLRSGKTYTLAQMKRRMDDNPNSGGVYKAVINEMAVTIQK